MPEQEEYVRLEESSLWKNLMEGGKSYPTKLHQLEAIFLSDKSQVWGYDIPHDAGVENESPGKNSLFKVIPEVPRDQFLRETNKDPLSGKYNNFDSPVSHIDRLFSPVCYMPPDIEVHHLAAAMMVLKQIYLYPERLRKYESGFDKRESVRNEENTAVREALNRGFDIIRDRGIEENFAEASAELSKKLPELTAFSPEYLEEVEEKYQSGLELVRKTRALMARHGQPRTPRPGSP